MTEPAFDDLWLRWKETEAALRAARPTPSREPTESERRTAAAREALLRHRDEHTARMATLMDRLRREDILTQEIAQQRQRHNMQKPSE